MKSTTPASYVLLHRRVLPTARHTWNDLLDIPSHWPILQSISTRQNIPLPELVNSLMFFSSLVAMCGLVVTPMWVLLGMVDLLTWGVPVWCSSRSIGPPGVDGDQEVLGFGLGGRKWLDYQLVSGLLHVGVSCLPDEAQLEYTGTIRLFQIGLLGWWITHNELSSSSVTMIPLTSEAGQEFGNVSDQSIIHHGRHPSGQLSPIDEGEEESESESELGSPVSGRSEGSFTSLESLSESEDEAETPPEQSRIITSTAMPLSRPDSTSATESNWDTRDAGQQRGTEQGRAEAEEKEKEGDVTVFDGTRSVPSSPKAVSPGKDDSPLRIGGEPNKERTITPVAAMTAKSAASTPPKPELTTLLAFHSSLNPIHPGLQASSSLDERNQDHRAREGSTSDLLQVSDVSMQSGSGSMSEEEVVFPMKETAPLKLRDRKHTRARSENAIVRNTSKYHTSSTSASNEFSSQADHQAVSSKPKHARNRTIDARQSVRVSLEELLRSEEAFVIRSPC